MRSLRSLKALFLVSTAAASLATQTQSQEEPVLPVIVAANWWSFPGGDATLLRPAEALGSGEQPLDLLTTISVDARGDVVYNNELLGYAAVVLTCGPTGCRLHGAAVGWGDDLGWAPAAAAFTSSGSIISVRPEDGIYTGCTVSESVSGTPLAAMTLWGIDLKNSLLVTESGIYTRFVSSALP
jgi:hypothetical protein